MAVRLADYASMMTNAPPRPGETTAGDRMRRLAMERALGDKLRGFSPSVCEDFELAFAGALQAVTTFTARIASRTQTCGMTPRDAAWKTGRIEEQFLKQPEGNTFGR